MSSASKNLVILMGNVGDEPELRFTPSGTQVANFSLATHEAWNHPAGERQERTEWHRLVAWAEKADRVAQHVHQGSKLYVEGKLQTRSWEDKSGQKRHVTEIVVNQIEFLDRRPDDPGPEGEVVSASGPTQEDFDDNLPF